MAGPPPRAGQLLPCQQREVTGCVLTLRAPGPPARWLEIAYLGQEGLEDQRVGLLPPEVMNKNGVWDTAWGSVTLGSGHPSGN